MKLKELRKKKGLTQEEMALLLNLTRITYSNYENEKTEPDIQTLCKMSKELNVSIDYIVGNENKFLYDTSKLSETQKALIKEIENLNEKNQTILFGYVTHMIYEQNK